MEQVPRLKESDKDLYEALLRLTENRKWNAVDLDHFLDKGKELPPDGDGPTLTIKNDASMMENRDAVCRSLERYIHEVLGQQGSQPAGELWEAYKRMNTFHLESAGYLETALQVYLKQGLAPHVKAAYLMQIVKKARANFGDFRDAKQHFNDFVESINNSYGGPQRQYQRD